MTTDITGRLPLNVYVIILGIGLFIFMLSMIFCCYLFRLRRQGTQEQYGYNEVVLKGPGKKLSLLGQTCAVCLEEFRSRDELGVCPCSHAFHKKCLGEVAGNSQRLPHVQQAHLQAPARLSAGGLRGPRTLWRCDRRGTSLLRDRQALTRLRTALKITTLLERAD